MFLELLLLVSGLRRKATPVHSPSTLKPPGGHAPPLVPFLAVSFICNRYSYLDTAASSAVTFCSSLTSREAQTSHQSLTSPASRIDTSAPHPLSSKLPPHPPPTGHIAMAACRGRRNNYRPELPCAHLLISAPSAAPPPLPSVSAPAVAFPPTAQPQSIPDASAWVDPAASLGPRYAQQRRMIPPRPPTYHPEVTALIARFHERGWLPRTFSGDAAAAAAAALGASTLSDTHRQAAAHLFSLKVTVELMHRLREQLYRMCDSVEGKEAQLLELEATMGSTVQHELQSLFEEITKASGVRIVSDPGGRPRGVEPPLRSQCRPASGRVSVGLAPPPAGPHHPNPQLDSSPPQEDVVKAPCGDEEDTKEREGVAEAMAPAPSLPSLAAAPSTRSVMSASTEDQGVLAPSEPVDPKGKRNLSRRPVRASTPSASAAIVAAPAPSTPSSLTERILLMRLVDQVALQLSHLEPKNSSEGEGTDATTSHRISAFRESSCDQLPRKSSATTETTGSAAGSSPVMSVSVSLASPRTRPAGERETPPTHSRRYSPDAYDEAGAILAAVASISGIRAATLWIREKTATGSPSPWLEAATWRGIGSGEVTVPAAIPSSIWAAQGSTPSGAFDILGFVPHPGDMEPRKLFLYLVNVRLRIAYAVLSVEADRDTRPVLVGDPPEVCHGLKLIMTITLSRVLGSQQSAS